MKRFIYILSVVILLLSAVLCRQIITHSIANQKNRADYAELNNIKYGLLNLQVWKQHIVKILIAEINAFDLSKKNEQDIRKKIKDMLDALINKAEINIREKFSDSTWGRIKLSILNSFVNLDEIKKEIPKYSDSLYNELITAKTKKHIKRILAGEVEKYSRVTYDTQDRSRLKKILSDTDSCDVETAKIKVNYKIKVLDKHLLRESLALIILTVILFFMTFIKIRQPASARYIFLIISLVFLLVTGVFTPLMNIEAKISSITFMIMGHPICFVDQILYFQSKSIINIFEIMIRHEDLMMKSVGILMITFSIIFPLLKMTSAIIYYFNFFKAGDNPVINFFVFKSGKWSMADVMAVAIFMSYVAFNGIIKSQLSYVNWIAQKQNILTLNGSTLQPGFFLFMSYALLALFFAVILARANKSGRQT